jgi:hypothetical protein
MSELFIAGAFLVGVAFYAHRVKSGIQRPVDTDDDYDVPKIRTQDPVSVTPQPKPAVINVVVSPTTRV